MPHPDSGGGALYSLDLKCPSPRPYVDILVLSLCHYWKCGGGGALERWGLVGKFSSLEGSQVASGTLDTSTSSFASQPGSQWLYSAQSSSHSVLPPRGPERWDQHTVDGNLHSTEGGVGGSHFPERRTEVRTAFDFSSKNTQGIRGENLR